jgi:hypothetical protein
LLKSQRAVFACGSMEEIFFFIHSGGEAARMNESKFG